MSHRTPIIGGNWKMNTTRESGIQLAREISSGSAEVVAHCQVVLFPPFPYLRDIGDVLNRSAVTLGAQDVFYEPKGAFTGEVSCQMLVDVGVQTVLAGHSERRHVMGESEDVINRKIRAALTSRLSVILCVGETIEQREANQVEETNIRQLQAGLEGVVQGHMRQVVIAYEPVWAIGTGQNATPDDAESVHQLIRAEVSSLYDEDTASELRIQYGGSVKSENAKELFAMPNIDGFLVGGASLKSGEFLDIVKAAAVAGTHA